VGLYICHVAQKKKKKTKNKQRKICTSDGDVQRKDEIREKQNVPSS
jgi:hypothetical protein